MELQRPQDQFATPRHRQATFPMHADTDWEFVHPLKKGYLGWYPLEEKERNIFQFNTPCLVVGR